MSKTVPDQNTEKNFNQKLGLNYNNLWADGFAMKYEDTSDFAIANKLISHV